jgi:hypothetical protein
MPRRYTQEEFIKRSKEVHGNKYDYSEVLYKNINTKVIIGCPIHGKIKQTPAGHLNSTGCPRCGKILNGKSHKSDTEIFIKKASNVHNNKYDYGKVVYNTSKENVIIVCPTHGEFLQTPNSHLRGGGCPKCGNERAGAKSTLSGEAFIKKAKKVHGNKYDYSKVKYINNRTKVIIGCPIHGDFLQKPNIHTDKGGCGCPICGKKTTKDKTTKTTDNFIKEAESIHGDRYTYHNTIYKNNKTNVKITCPIHGDFLQMPYNHLSGMGCRKCADDHRNPENNAKLYIINLYNKKENFYKVGVTYRPQIETRLAEIPNKYNIKILKIFECKMKEGRFLERTILDQFKPFKYIPEIEFGGLTECLSVDPTTYFLTLNK